VTVKAQPTSDQDHRLRRLATYASATVATILIAAKLAAFLFTNSVAVLSSLLDSTMDLIASLVTVFGVASALRPPDHDHRYGHGKAEPLAALAQSAFIAGSSVLLIYQAASRLYHPEPVRDEKFGYGVMALAIVFTVVLVMFQNHVVRRTRSTAIGADQIHYVGDLAVNMGVALSFALYSWTGIEWLDPVFAILIAVGLSISAFRIAVKALHLLMDRELPDADREKIKIIASSRPEVRGLHDLRTRSDGERVFIEFHLELDGNMSLKTAHHIDEAITDDILKSFPNADILIHQDPAGIEEPRLDEQIEVGALRK